MGGGEGRGGEGRGEEGTAHTMRATTEMPGVSGVRHRQQHHNEKSIKRNRTRKIKQLLHHSTSHQKTEKGGKVRAQEKYW